MNKDDCNPELSYDDEDGTWWVICTHCAMVLPLDTNMVLSVIPVEELEVA